MNREPRIKDEYVLHSVNGLDYKIIVININNCRPPDMKYGLDMWDNNGIYIGDVMFVGEDFFNNSNVEFVKNKGD